MSMNNRFARLLMISGGLLLALSGILQAAEWSAPLKSGGTVTVDPETNRATVRRNGMETQLWDGIHQLEDGSTLTIRSGTAVPNKDILRARKLPSEPEPSEAERWLGTPIVGYSPCERLVRRVCGVNQACGSSKGCDPARQLLSIEQNERKANDSPNYTTPASGQCQQADRDRDYFVTCAQGAAPGNRRLQ